MRKWVVVLFCLPLAAFGMLEERGSLYDFLFDDCPDCAYDNWLSHVSERVVRDEYNDYGPPNLDPVTNGFGGFTYINDNPAGDSTLAHWRQTFDFAIAKNWNSVDSMVTLYDNEWNYEFVHLRESVNREGYYLLRERLDSSFVDVNGDTLAGNDVIGGFRKGWGVFIFNPNPRHATAIVEVPHPEDDYMAPPVAADLFVRAEFAILMIAGAGREVMWDSTHQTFNNTLSFSDPSRNGRHPFQMLHEAAQGVWDTPPVSPFITIQMHSYDHNEHVPLGDMQMTCFYNDHYPNPPIRDVGQHRDVIHALPMFPIRSIDGDTMITTRVDEYISLWSSPPYSWFGADTIPLRNITDFLGAPENQQGNYCHADHDAFLHTENFVHIELDEYPDRLWQPTDFLRWLPGNPPAHLSNFRLVREYYAPLVTALDSALTWHEIPDTTAPDEVRIKSVIRVNNSTVDLTWKGPAFDQHFDTYEIFYDTTEITESSPFRTRTSYSTLGIQTTTDRRLLNLPLPPERYRFAIRARDMAGNVSAFSPEWGIIDTVLHDVSISVVEDSLNLFWTPEYYDSLYEVREYVQDTNDYYLIGTTSAPEYTITSVVTDRRAHIIKVKRIIRQ
ncbi:MAG: hypothetical protein IPP40_09475 [bacterium]|nr:hypothetical protein [bacterium]